MRVISLMSAVVLAVAVSGCTKGGSVDSAAMDFAKAEYAKGMDRSLDQLYGKKPGEAKDKLRDYVNSTTSFKIESVEKKSETESQVTVEIDQVEGNAMAGLVFLAVLGGSPTKKGEAAKIDIPAIVADLEKKEGKKMPHEKKTLKLMASLENDQWKFSEMPKERSTASAKKTK